MTADDEPLEPARRAARPGSGVTVGVLAFVAGAAAMGGAAWMLGLRPAPPPPPAPAVAAPATQPHAAPSPVLPAATDVATLSARETELAGRLDRIETRLREADEGARTAESKATQAERLLLAASVRRAIERGLPLGPLEIQLRRRFGETEGDAVATLAQAAAQPVTLEDLRLALETIAPRLSSAPGEGWLAGMRRLIGDLVVLRQSDSPSPRPADRLRRARRALDEGQVEAALAEIAHMPGAGAAASWLDAARRYVAAREALRRIEAAAMATPETPR
ncbi:hypothetical protein ACFQ1E_02300 [Sphingomonas canadensis]|uniref:Inner membrane protein n=1 Tax=Sphingomonas canadensis TaxID=1219257 RepID=A0ABW3H160_9SPHN|nr:hypothetical protein [Sphingomonas canadensis]MCW3834927.1 hypothetical protein [Sphingomonas canadensis]